MVITSDSDWNVRSSRFREPEFESRWDLLFASPVDVMDLSIDFLPGRRVIVFFFSFFFLFFDYVNGFASHDLFMSGWPPVAAGATNEYVKVNIASLGELPYLRIFFSLIIY